MQNINSESKENYQRCEISKLMDQWLSGWGISNSSSSSIRAPRSNWLFKWSSPFFIFFLTTLHFWPRLFHNWNFKSQSLFPLIRITGSLMCILLLPFHLSKSWSKNTVYPRSTQAIVGTHYLMVRWTFMGGFLLTEDWKYMMGDKWSGAFIGSKVTSEKEKKNIRKRRRKIRQSDQNRFANAL